jgi:uncharacterized protein YcnI
MKIVFPRRRTASLLLALGTALVGASSAGAHAHVSPPVALAKEGQVFTLAVPTEKESATTTTVELTPPDGFSIDSFADAPGWTRKTETKGSGEEAVVQKVTWSGGHVPAGGAAMFQFIASPESSKTYTFGVRQTYSDGEVVNWSGPESSDTPAPTIEATSDLGGGGGSSSTLGIIALVVAGIALVVAVVSFFAGSGRRALA